MSGFEAYYSLWWIIAAILTALVLFIGILPIMFESLYKRRYVLPGETLAQLEAETRSTMGQVAVGLAGFVVLWTAVESIGTTNKTLELSSKSFRLSESTHLAERFSEAVKLLYEESHSTRANSALDAGSVARIGGIFALSRIVESDGAYREPTLHVLAAMVQKESPRSFVKQPGSATRTEGLADDYLSTGEDGRTVFRYRPCDWLDAHPELSPYAPPLDHEGLAPDIIAALTVIGRLGISSTTMIRPIDLSKANLCFGYLKAGTLPGAWFRHSDLRGAILDEADLTRAGLVAVDLTGAHLLSAKLREATLVQANLSSADLSGADLWNANLDDVNLIGADLRTAKNLTQDQLDQACGSRSTKLPHGLIVADCSTKAGSK